MNYLKYFLILISFTSLIYSQDINNPHQKVISYKLKNGMDIYMLADKNLINTSINVIVNVGSNVENKDNAGLSHLVEHIVFRDSNIPHNDYLDYFIDEGASDVNGYTGLYNTTYVTTIDSSKSYWIVENFSKMLFNKNVTKQDLKIEKAALQVEIGELTWFDYLKYYLSSFFSFFSTPDSPDIYTSDFNLQKQKEYPDHFIYRSNNKDFTFKEVMSHYEKYYYPSNMTLKITGNFDIDQMKKTIQNTFGSINKEGTYSAKEPPYNATLNNKAYTKYYIGYQEKNKVHIGIKYLINDFKDYQILNIYFRYLSNYLQTKLRNKLGQTYSVNRFNYSYLNAGIIGVTFEALHDDLDKNIQIVKDKIEKDLSYFSDKEIQKALEYAQANYDSLEYNTQEFMYIININEYMNKYHNINNISAYDMFKSISTNDFRDTLQKYIKPQNSYFYYIKDYYFFPFDNILLLFTLLFFTIFAYTKLHVIRLKQIKSFYTQRDIILSRRLSSRFIGFIKFLIIFFIATYLSEWFEYMIGSQLNIYDFYYTFDAPYNYIYTITSFIIFFIFFLFISKYIFRSIYSRIDVTKDKIHFVGSNISHIEKENISNIRDVKWSIKHFFKTYGFALLFYKPLVVIETHYGKSFYVRSSNSKHLKEDLLKWKES